MAVQMFVLGSHVLQHFGACLDRHHELRGMTCTTMQVTALSV